MQIIIKTKNIELSGQLQSFIDKKIGGLKKFIGGFENHSLPITEGRMLFDTFVEVERDSNHHNKGQVYKAEVKMYLPGRNLFAKASADDITKAILEVREQLESEIRKHKGKIVEFPRRQAKQKKQEF